VSPVAVGLVLLVVCAWIEGMGSAAHLLEAAVYTAVLAQLDLSIAYPLSALTFITTTCLSLWLLRETVTPTRWIGVLLILAGAVLLGSSA
jgi:multidrug transporter EmrE-like cation transporter